MNSLCSTICALFIGFLAIWLAPELSAQARMTLVLDKKVFVSGEPIGLNITFTNPQESKLLLDTGPNRTVAFSHKLLNSSSQTLCEATDEKRGGASVSGRIVIPPRESVTRKLILNRWCSTQLPPGEYVILTSFRDASATSIFIRAEGRFSIAADNKAVLRQVLSEAYSNLSEHIAPEEMEFLVGKITYSGLPEAVPFIEKILFRNDINLAWKATAIGGLGRIPSPSAAKLLVQIVKQDSFREELKSKAVDAAYQMYDDLKNKKLRAADILQELKWVLDHYPRSLKGYG